MESSGNKLRAMLLVFSSFILFLSLCGPTQAATFCVSDATEIQAALTTAAANGEEDLIHIVQATYVGNFIYTSNEAYGVTIEGGYSMGCASRVVEANNTVLDGDEIDYVLVLLSRDQAVPFKIDGVTFQNGSATGAYGGGIYINTNGGQITLTNNIIKKNSADYDGGGLFAKALTLTLTNNIITENVASNGGGVFAQVTNLNFSNCSIKGNYSSYKGGGVYVSESSGVISFTSNTIENNVIAGNNTNEGGGVYASASSGTISFTNNSIANNSNWVSA